MHKIIVPPNLEEITERIIGCAIAVHRALGPGLLESVYRECLLIELALAGLRVAREKSIPLHYRGQRVPTSLRIDLVVEDCVVVELKAVEHPNPIHLAQVVTYLKLTDCPAGLLFNFNHTSLRQGLHRLNHPQLHAAKKQIGRFEVPRVDQEPVALPGNPSGCPEFSDRS